jgi:hypothetical protein
MAGDSIRPAPSAPRGSHPIPESHALEERLQNLRARNGRPTWRDAERGGPLPGGLQEIDAGDGRRYARQDRRQALSNLLDRPTPNLVL